jgi:hypothetical protein
MGTSPLSTVASGHLEPMLRLYCHWGGIAGLGRDVVKVGIGTAVGGFDVVDDTGSLVCRTTIWLDNDGMLNGSQVPGSLRGRNL